MECDDFTRIMLEFQAGNVRIGIDHHRPLYQRSIQIGQKWLK
jgi:hypothetical protein